MLFALELRDFAGERANDLAETILYHCLSAGLSFKVGQGNVLVLAPPLNISLDDLEWALACLEQAFSLCTNK